MKKLAFILFVCLAAPPSTAGQSSEVTIRLSKRLVRYGDHVLVSGALANAQSNASVIVSIRRYGQSSFVPVSNSSVTPNGGWAFSFEPTVRSQLRASSGEAVSRIVTVRVKPKLTLTRRHGALFARAVAAGSFRGRHVWFQRRSSDGRWRSVRKVVLDDPPRRFTVKLPKGVSRVRVSLSRRQAGPGYEPTVSRVLVLRRA